MLGGFVRLLKNEDGFAIIGRGSIAGVIRDRRGAVAVLLAVALSGIVGVAGLGSEAARPHVRLSMGQPVSPYAGNEGCAG
jgi:hypothetical protein